VAEDISLRATDLALLDRIEERLIDYDLDDDMSLDYVKQRDTHKEYEGPNQWMKMREWDEEDKRIASSDVGILAVLLSELLEN